MAGINTKDSDDRTAFHIAVDNDDIETVKSLLENTADINIPNSSGETPLDLAVKIAQHEIAQRFIPYNPKVDVESTDDLQNKVPCPTLDIFNKYILELGAKVNTVPAMACMMDDHEIYKMLMAYGADIKLINGDTALHISIDQKDIQTVKILLENRDYISRPHPSSLTPLHLALVTEDNKMVQRLIQYEPKLQPVYGSVLLQCAVFRGYTDIVKYLLEHGVNVNSLYTLKDAISFGKCNTVLHIACMKGYPEIVEMLMAYGADMYVKNDYGKIALHIAMEKEDSNCIESLLKKRTTKPVGINDGTNPDQIVVDSD